MARNAHGGQRHGEPSRNSAPENIVLMSRRIITKLNVAIDAASGCPAGIGVQTIPGKGWSRSCACKVRLKLSSARRSGQAEIVAWLRCLFLVLRDSNERSPPSEANRTRCAQRELFAF